MSHWVCCNSCFLSPNNERRLAVTSCGHVVCNVCYQRSKPNECLICNTRCQVSPLTSKSSPEVKALFTDVGDTMKKHMMEINKVLVFQARHQKRHLTYYKQRSGKLEEVLTKMKQDMQQMSKKLNEQSSYISKLEYSLQHQSAKSSPTSFSSHMQHKSVMQYHQQSPQRLSRHPSTLSLIENMEMDDSHLFRKPITASRLSLINSPQRGRIGPSTLSQRPASQNNINHSTSSATVSRSQGAPGTPDMTFGRMSGWQSPLFKTSTPLQLSPVPSLFRHSP